MQLSLLRAVDLHHEQGHDRNTSAKSVGRGTAVNGRPPDRVAKWHGQIRVQALFFGDFFLGQQKKVTRLPGRDPACNE